MGKLMIGIAGLVLCLALLLRMFLGPSQRHRFDTFWRARWHALAGAGRWLRRQWRLLRARRGAQADAASAIERARRARPDVDREGNVLRPRNFRRPDDDEPPLH